jgi:hypothetical protein
LAEQDRRNAGGKQPISRHPLFPVTVALWCGALFGLGSLAATAALGTTARVLIAVVMAGVGAVAGAKLARRIADPQRSAGDASHEAHHVAASADKADEHPGGGRRRTLVPGKQQVKPDNPRLAPSDAAPRILDVADVDFEGFASDSKPAAEELSAPEVDAGRPDNRHFEATAAEPKVEPQADSAPAPQMSPAAQRIASAALDELSHVELLERLALSMQRRSEEAGKKDAVAAMGIDRRPAVREDEPAVDRRANGPAVVFPGQAERRHGRFADPSSGSAEAAPPPADHRSPAASAERQDAEDSEEALRAALSALQKISGAA